MAYTVLRGEFVIRDAELPRGGPEPDGDTVRFVPDAPELAERLPRRSGRPPRLGPRGVSVRLEAVDALETHFGGSHQEPAGALAARDALLAGLGFTGVTFWSDLPNRVQSADADRLRGHVVTNGVDANGRLIAFVYPGESRWRDGARVVVDPDLVDASVNARLLRRGLAFAAIYDTLPAPLRAHCARRAHAARTATPPRGVLRRATADPGGAATVRSRADLERLVLWPKLFRRLLPYLATGAADLGGFGDWLRDDPVDRDDELVLVEGARRVRLHDLVRTDGDTVAMTVWPDDVVISPDPPAAVGRPEGRAG